MKRVTITYTRQDLSTPWYWQIPSGLSATTYDDYLTQNRDKIEQFGYPAEQGYKCIVILTFADQQSYDDFRTMISSNIAPGYTQYCEDNNITIERLEEDV